MQSILHLAAEPSAQQVAAVIRAKLVDNAVKISAVYQKAGFRQPNVALRNAGAAPTLAMTVASAGRGSHYSHGGRDAAWTLRFGQLIIDPAEVDDVQFQHDHPGFGLIVEGLAHEMLHAILAGYDVSGRGSRGLHEGTASNGMTIEAAGAPQVRTLKESEILLLSRGLGLDEGASTAYSNQDFLAYVERTSPPSTSTSSASARSSTAPPAGCAPASRPR